MLHMLSKILLAPVLIMQGKSVRRHTPRLPEASGAREGEIHGEVPALRVLICGDSAAAGVGVEGQQQALAGQVVRELQRRFPRRNIAWKLWAKNGDTTAVTLVKLHLRPAEEFDVIITSLGVNDVTGRTGRGRFRLQQQALLKLLKSKFKAKQIMLTALPPMHLFPALPLPLRWVLGHDAKALTAEMERAVAGQHGCSVLHANFPIREGVVANDGFHPGPIGYQMWAQAIVRKINDCPSE